MSLRKRPSQSFILSHGSVLFLAVTLVLAVILMSIGLSLSRRPSTSVAGFGILMLQFSGALMAVALTAFLFSLPDLRHYLAGTVATLLSRGDVIPLLSRHTKATLFERIWLDLASNKAESLQPALLSHLRTVGKHCFESPYATSYNFALAVSQAPGNAGLLIDHSVMSYVLHVDHLHNRRLEMPFHFFRCVSFPRAVAPDETSWLRDFHVDIGSNTYGAEDVRVSVEDRDDIRTLQAVFTADITVSEYVHITVDTELLVTPHDSVEAVFARYASQGFNVTYTFSDSYNYECWWFTHCEILEDAPSKGRIIPLRNGISASTAEWVLPGEGVVLYHMPKADLPTH